MNGRCAGAAVVAIAGALFVSGRAQAEDPPPLLVECVTLDGAPAAGVKVEMRAAGTPSQSARSDETGRVTFRRPPPESGMAIHLSGSRWWAYSVDVYWGDLSARHPIRLPALAPVEVTGRVVLPAGARAAGTVRARQVGLKLGDWRVPLDQRGPRTLLESDGSFRLTVPAGFAWNLEVVGPDVAPTTMTVPATARDRFDAGVHEVPRAARVRARLLDPVGVGVAGARLTLESNARDVEREWNWTQRRYGPPEGLAELEYVGVSRLGGEVRIFGLGSGDARLIVDGDAFDVRVLEAKGLVAGEERDLGDVHLTRATGRIQGTLRADDGKAVPGALLKATNAAGLAAGVCNADATGRFVMTAVRSGPSSEVAVECWHRGYAKGRWSVKTGGEDVSLVLERGPEVTYRVASLSKCLDVMLQIDIFVDGTRVPSLVGLALAGRRMRMKVPRAESIVIKISANRVLLGESRSLDTRAGGEHDLGDLVTR